MTEDVDALLQDEREQLRRLQGSLRAERERILAESAAEIARTQSELRRAAQHAAERERELETLQARLERKLEGRRFSLRRAPRGEADRARDDEARQRLLSEREQAVAQHEELLREREQELDRREQHEELLREREQELDRREQQLARLSEPTPERPQAPPRARPRAVAPATTFADGLRALAGGAARVEPGRGRRRGKLVASSPVLLALSSAQKAGLAGMGAAFIVFALISSMVIPHYRPTFPARLLGAFLGVVGVFTVGMVLTVFFVARETGEEEAHAAKPEAPAGTGETGTTPAAPKGNPTAGKTIFTDPNVGCFGCHTLQAAGSTGTVGPNLDEAKPDLALIVERVTNGKSPMPPFKGRLSPAQIDDVAAFVYESTHS